MLDQLLHEIKKLKLNKPLYLKMPADSSREQYEEILEMALRHGVKGVIVSNLTKKRELLTEKNQKKIAGISGGLSGRPCFALALERIAQTYKYVD